MGRGDHQRGLRRPDGRTTTGRIRCPAVLRTETLERRRGSGPDRRRTTDAKPKPATGGRSPPRRSRPAAPLSILPPGRSSLARRDLSALFGASGPGRDTDLADRPETADRTAVDRRFDRDIRPLAAEDGTAGQARGLLAMRLPLALRAVVPDRPATTDRRQTVLGDRRGQGLPTGGHGVGPFARRRVPDAPLRPTKRRFRLGRGLRTERRTSRPARGFQPRRQVVPAGESSRTIPWASSSSRRRSASVQSRFRRASLRRSIRASISASARPPPPALERP